eukprot:CAMPEP_0177440292 /NCGR_PEP_ID=MMETSP0369-20130122/3779_1 /TAXON_ID=447022 ORGANISM="Scrippsiella hangoei-like, Strain SHHI-4" /NCGR_SAMPLE_ID=MMETSP0369 /ASSEMBLY_ACC=CAM_ASM_000364 /LENGTH=45 /DNA_ID= /DNA_START= /DNA_END= /DNA_ORIENTATION=
MPPEEQVLDLRLLDVTRGSPHTLQLLQDALLLRIEGLRPAALRPR